MIPEVDAVAIEVEDNVLIAHTAIGLDTPVIDAISYMADLLVLLSWLSLLIIQHVRVLFQGAHQHLRGSFLHPVNMSFPKFVTLHDRRTGKTIGIGHESQGLFHLSSPLCSTACTSTEAPLLLHSRLGHPSLSKFRKLVPHFSSLSSLEYESCQLGKHTRVLFPKRLDPRTKFLFELVHIDVWGPSRSTSTLGFRYFVTFIDDYSRCTWLFLMKTQVELFSIFQKFHAEIRTQFNTSIRILRSDNAKEYFSMSFSSFISSHGILHQSSCAYAPQQNGVAERKNRHLVETARTFLLHHKVPQCFWGDAILVACYLINRMPSSVLHDQIPHSILLPTQPLFYLLPRVFGLFVLFIFSLLDKTNSLPKPRSVSSWVILAFRGVIVVILLILIATLSLLMSYSLKIPPSPLQCVLLLQMSYLFLLFYPLPISLPYL